MHPISPGMANTRSKVKRVVVTSSCAAILQPGRFDKIYNEEDWNAASVKNVNASGREATNRDKYLASKTLAEKGMFSRSASFMHADLKKHSCMGVHVEKQGLDQMGHGRSPPSLRECRLTPSLDI